MRTEGRLERQKQPLTLDVGALDRRPGNEHARALGERARRVVLAERADSEMHEHEPVRRAFELDRADRIAALGRDRDRTHFHDGTLASRSAKAVTRSSMSGWS
jgi:hypothetical protein